MEKRWDMWKAVDNRGGKVEHDYTDSFGTWVVADCLTYGGSDICACPVCFGIFSR